MTSGLEREVNLCNSRLSCGQMAHTRMAPFVKNCARSSPTLSHVSRSGAKSIRQPIETSRDRVSLCENVVIIIILSDKSGLDNSILAGVISRVSVDNSRNDHRAHRRPITVCRSSDSNLNCFTELGLPLVRILLFSQAKPDGAISEPRSIA